MKLKHLFILLAIVLIGVAALYFFVVLPDNEDGTVEEINVNTSVTNTNQANANSNSAVSMLTYQNDQYGFSLQYPKTATVSTSEFLTSAGSIYIVQPGDPEYDAYEEYTLNINVGLIGGKTLEEFAEHNTQKTGIAASVDGINARRVETRGDNEIYINTFFIDEQDNYYDFYIAVGQPIFAGEVLGVHSQEYLDSVLNTYNSIIESFKFTN